MADAGKTQSQSLTTGRDTKKTPNAVVAQSAQPNRKRESGHLWANIFVIAFCGAGLGLTLQGKVRGDDFWFKVAFAVSLGISGAEVILNIVLMIIGKSDSSSSNNTGNKSAKCCAAAACLGFVVNLVYIAGCCVCFGLLVHALKTSTGLETSDNYGCVNGYGCANIMAIIAAISYGGRIVAIAIAIQCLICMCCCAACCFCCGASSTAERGEAPTTSTGQQQKTATSKV